MEDRPLTQAARSSVLAVAAVIFLGTIISPPSLLDDVDATYAQIARTMLESGDWVTARLNGVKYFDKPPGQVWAIAASFAIFGVHDWAARIPLALAAVLLCFVTARLGAWAFGEVAGKWAGLSLATCVGLWLFTRVRIPDAALALTITISIAAVLRIVESKAHWGWSALLGAAVGAGTLIKGLPAIVLPAGAVIAFVVASRLRGARVGWPGLQLGWGLAAFLLCAAPWHILAIAANPPYFDFTMASAPGEYRGFFWRYFINEHVLRYLGLRYPRDYNTVPWLYYWAMHLVWLFPWSAFFPAAARLDFRPKDRAGRVRLMALCWLGFVTVFFALSTSQEYYTLSAYPAIALLVGDAVARRSVWVSGGTKTIAIVAGLACAAACGLLVATASAPADGDISQTLTSNPEAYTLSLGHMQDLTIEAFAYLRGPLALAASAFLIGAVSCWKRQLAGAVVMMMLFVHAARWAMVSFDPYLSSRPLAQAYLSQPAGRLVLDDQYYSFSSLVFYANQEVLLLNGRVNNIEYGSNAPGAPDVFLTDESLATTWAQPDRYYLATFVDRVPNFEATLGRVREVASAGGKVLLTNH